MGRMSKTSLKPGTAKPRGSRKPTSASEAKSQIQCGENGPAAAGGPWNAIVLSDSDEEEEQKQKQCATRKLDAPAPQCSSERGEGGLASESAPCPAAMQSGCQKTDGSDLLQRLQAGLQQGAPMCTASPLKQAGRPSAGPKQAGPQQPPASPADRSALANAETRLNRASIGHQGLHAVDNAGARQSSQGMQEQTSCFQSWSVEFQSEANEAVLESSVARSIDFSKSLHLDAKQGSRVELSNMPQGEAPRCSASSGDFPEKETKCPSSETVGEEPQPSEVLQPMATPMKASMNSMNAIEEESEDDGFAPLLQYGNRRSSPKPFLLLASSDSDLEDDDSLPDPLVLVEDSWPSNRRRRSQKRPKPAETSPRKKPEPPELEDPDAAEARIAFPSPPKLPREEDEKRQAELMERRRQRREAAESLTWEATEAVLKRIESEAAVAATAALSAARTSSSAGRSSHQMPAGPPREASAEAVPGPASSVAPMEGAEEGEGEQPGGAAAKVMLRLSRNEGEAKGYRFGRTKPFGNLFAAYAKSVGGAPEDFRFLFDGAGISPQSTPEELDMEDDDMIEVVAAPSQA